MFNIVAELGFFYCWNMRGCSDLGPVHPRFCVDARGACDLPSTRKENRLCFITDIVSDRDNMN